MERSPAPRAPRSLTFTLVFSLGLGACARALPGDLDTGDVPAEVTYTEHVQPLMQAWCVRCHDSEGQMDGGVALDSYLGVYGTRVKTTCVTVGQDVVDAYADVLLPFAGQQDLAACEGWKVGSMPPGAQPHLVLADQVTLARWVEQGGAQ